MANQYITRTREILAEKHGITDIHEAYWLANSRLTEGAANQRWSPERFADSLAEQPGKMRWTGRHY